MASPYAPLPAERSSTSSHRSSSSDRRKSQSISGSDFGSEHEDDNDLSRLELSASARGRQDTLSAFAFPALTGLGIPLTLSENLDGSGARNETGKQLGVVNGVALVVGLQIGSGIFSSPGVLLSSTGSPGAALLVWIASGLLAWSGASSYVELGAAIPVNGGSQAYLNYAYGPLVSYLFSWTAVSLLKPGSAAIISLIFGEYVMRLVYASSTKAASADETAPVSNGAPDWTFKLLGSIIILIVTGINLANARAGAHVQVGLTSIKMLSLVFILILAFVYALTHGLGNLSSASSASGAGFWDGSTSEIGRYAIALFSGLWAYDGWDQTNYVAGEMKNVSRDLPRVVHSSMAIVVALFSLVNLSYFLVLPRAVVGASNTVALDFGAATLGTAGALVFSVLVATSCFGALNGSTITTSMLVVQAGREGWLPRIFGELWSGGRAGWAMLLQASLTIAYILFGGGFRSLINFFSVANWLFYFLTVLGLLILRVKEPHLERPYQTWLGTPITFCVVALFLLIMPVVAAPTEALAAFAFIGLGVPLYYITSAVNSDSSEGWWSVLWRQVRAQGRERNGGFHDGQRNERQGMMMSELR